MSTTNKNTLKQWFGRGAKPLASQFAAWIDAFWHKNEIIPVAQIEGLEEALAARKLKTVIQTSWDFNSSSITAPCYVKIVDDETISMDADFFARVEPEVLFYLQCTGQVLIADGYSPDGAYAACTAGTVRELSVYVDIDGIPVVTVFEKPLKMN
jgi:hypothetical protein